MSETTTDPLIESYLKRLRSDARALPRGPRDELIEQIEEHIHEAVPPGSSEVDTRNALEQLGDPDVIVAEEFDRLGLRRTRAGKLEWGAIFLLPFGAVLIPIVGWLAGVLLLWASRVWSTREKVIGTVVVPGGLSALVYLALIGAGSTCTGSVSPGFPRVERCSAPALPPIISIPLFLAFVIGGIATPILLAHRALASRR